MSAAAARHEVHHSGRKRKLLQEARQTSPQYTGLSLDGLSTTVLPVTTDASVIPAIIASGKFHGGIDDANAERDVVELVLLAGKRDKRLLPAVADHLARVELGEVDRLGNIAVGFGPRLSDFQDHQAR